MKKILSVLFVVLLALGLVACSSNEEETTNDDSDADSNVVTISVGTSPDYAPYESLNTDNEIVGFDVEMLKLFETYLSEEYGTEYEFSLVSMDFDNIITQIQGDQVDIGVSGFSYSEEREEAVSFSEPYCLSKQVVLVLADSEYESVDELEGKVLAAQTGTTGEYAAQDLVGEENVSSIQSVLDMIPGLDAQQYDAVVLDSAVANSYAATGKYKVLPEELVNEANYIVVKKGNEEMLDTINFCIEKFVASDEYKTLCEEYQLSPVEE